ncbi:MAG: arylsulfotransferase family protein [Acidobacteriota bacterium]
MAHPGAAGQETTQPSGAPWLEASAIAVVAAGLFRATWLHSYDDAYITYAYARSFATAQGLTWHGVATLGTTSPFLAVVLGSLARATGAGIPTLGHVLSWAWHAAGSIGLCALLRRELGRIAAVAISFLWLASPAVLNLLGGEHVMAIGAALCAASAMSRRSFAMAGALFAAATALRMEIGLAAIPIAAAILATQGRAARRGIARSASVGAVLLGAWLLILSALAAGRVVPATLAAKRAQAESTLGIWRGGLGLVRAALGQARAGFLPSLPWLAAALAILGGGLLVLEWRKRPAATALVLWGWLHLLVLACLGVPYYPWYGMPLHLAIVVAAGSLLAPPAWPGSRWRRPALGLASIGIACSIGASTLENVGRHLRGPIDGRADAYARLASWIDEHYPPATTAAAFEVGYLGFAGRFRLADLLRLVTPEVRPDDVASGRLAGAPPRLDPDLFVWNTGLPPLNRSVAPALDAFLRGRRLDHLESMATQNQLVYRRATLAQRGEIAIDLLAVDGVVEHATMVREGDQEIPGLRLAPGERVVARVALPAAATFAAGVARLGNGACALRVTLETASGAAEDAWTLADRLEWRTFAPALPPGSAEPVTIVLQCARRSEVPCVVVIPRILAAAPPRPSPPAAAGGAEVLPPGFQRSRVERDPGTSEDVREEIARLESLGYAGGVIARPGGGVTLHDRGRSSPGYIFYTSGHAPEAFLASLDGKVIHRWRYEYERAFPQGAKGEGSAFFRRAHLCENGDVLAIFEGLGIVRLDAGSNLLWARANGAHHDLEVAADGTIYVLGRKARVLPRLGTTAPVLEDFVLVLDPAGEELCRVSIIDAIERSSYRRILQGRHIAAGDIFHTNTIRLLDGTLAGHIPAFAPGRVLVCLNYESTIGVLDLREERFVWAYQWGEIGGTHDPEVLPDGRLLVFRNGDEATGSRVVELDPVTGQVAWEYRGSPASSFFSYRCGAAQRLPNGNTLITESEGGRAFETTASGDVVWEFVNPARAGEKGELIAIVPEMVRLPIDFPVGEIAGGDAVAPPGAK